MKILVESMEGVGDCIYQRPFIKQLIGMGHEVYIRVYLHDLYSDIVGLKFLKPKKDYTYRTQEKQRNQQSKIQYAVEPKEFDEIVKPLYSGKDLVHDSIIYTMFHKFGIEPNNKLEWTLPYFETHKNPEYQNIKKIIYDSGKPLAIMRPSTIRKEWEVYTRSPDPTYLFWVSHVLHEMGYFVISIADANGTDEWIEQPEPYADMKLHDGELGIYGTLDLMRGASVVVGGSGFIVPACVSLGVPLFVLFGGRGAYDSPYKIFHASMDLRKVGWALPRNFCRCTLNKHNCDKSIPDLDDKFMTFMRQLQLLEETNDT